MGMYTASSLQLLCDLVNRDNPGLPQPFTPQNVALKGTPIAKAVNGRNTQVTFVAKPGRGLQGTLTVYYDRINLTSLFKSPTALVRIPRTAKTYGDVLPAFNEKHGLNLTPADIQLPERAIALYATPESLPILAHTDSVCYTGGATINYLPEPIGYYPNSGPGTKYLMAGNEVNGYFGVVTPSELFTAVELTAAVFGTGQNGQNFNWLKFYLNGEITYFPTYYLINTSWESLYNAGAMFGTDDGGKPPVTITTPVNQVCLVSKVEGNNRSYFRIRSPFYQEIVTAPDMGQPASVKSIYSLLKKLGNFTNYGEWGKLDGALGYLGSEVWTTHTSGDQAYYIAMDGSIMRNTYTYVSAGWGPQLTLMDPATIVKPLTDVELDLHWAARALPITGGSSSVQIHPIQIDRSEVVTLLPLPGGAGYPDKVLPLQLDAPTVVALKPLSGEGDYPDRVRPIGLDSPHVDMPRPLYPTDKALGKFNLSTANGELEGFK